MLRRHLWLWVAVAMVGAIAAFAAAAIVLPATAGATTCSPDGRTCPTWPACEAGTVETGRAAGGAPICEPRTASPRHVGWTYLNLNYCAPGRMCAAIFQATMPAWRWNGRSWVRATLPGGWVYVYPYTGDWRWAWTPRTGWVAVDSGRFELRRW